MTWFLLLWAAFPRHLLITFYRRPSWTAWQATILSPDSSRHGDSILQRACMAGQRGWKEQPEGGLMGFGTSPVTGCRFRFVKLRSGIVSSSIRVYGCCGLLKRICLGATSHRCPRYMTPTSDESRTVFHQQFAGNIENATVSVKSHLINCVKATGPLM